MMNITMTSLFTALAAAAFAAGSASVSAAGTNTGLWQQDAIGNEVDADFLPQAGLFYTEGQGGTGIAFEVMPSLIYGAYYNFNPDGTQAYQVFSAPPTVNDYGTWGATGIMAEITATPVSTSGGQCPDCEYSPITTAPLPHPINITWTSPRRAIVTYNGVERVMTPLRELSPDSSQVALMTKSAWRRFEIRELAYDPNRKFEHQGVVLRLEPRTEDEKWYFHLDTSEGARTGPYWVTLPTDDQIQYKWVCKGPLAHTTLATTDDKDNCSDIFPEGGLSEYGRPGNPNEVIWQDAETGEFYGIAPPNLQFNTGSAECPFTQETINGREVTRVCVDDLQVVYAYYPMSEDRVVRRSWRIATAERGNWSCPDPATCADEGRSYHTDQFMQRMPLEDDVYPQESWK